MVLRNRASSALTAASQYRSNSEVLVTTATDLGVGMKAKCQCQCLPDIDIQCHSGYARPHFDTLNSSLVNAHEDNRDTWEQFVAMPYCETESRESIDDYQVEFFPAKCVMQSCRDACVVIWIFEARRLQIFDVKICRRGYMGANFGFQELHR